MNKIYDFTDATKFIFDSSKVVHNVNKFLLKDLRPANATAYANYSVNKNMTWADGVKTGTLLGLASVDSGYLKFTNTLGDGCTYPALDNADSAQTLTYRIRIVPQYTGPPATAQVFIGTTKTGILESAVAIVHLPTGQLRLTLFDENGINLSVDLGAWAAVFGVPTEIELNADFTAAIQRMFIDGIIFATQNIAMNRDTSEIQTLLFGEGITASQTPNFWVQDFIIFSTVQHTSNYVPDWNISPTIYDTSNPTLEPVDAEEITNLEAFSSTITKSGNDEVKFINKKSDDWKYYNTSWVDSNQSYAQSNLTSIVNTNAGSFSLEPINYKWRAFFHSDNGNTTPELSGLSITFNNIAVTVGVNSWVTGTEANTYLSTKFGADDWAALPDTTKTKLLITAFWWIFNYPGVTIPKTSTAESVKNAQIELAWWCYNYLVEYEKREALIAGGVTEFRLSKWMEKLSAQDLPKRILNMLDDELVNLGGYFPTFDRELEN